MYKCNVVLHLWSSGQLRSTVGWEVYFCENWTIGSGNKRDKEGIRGGQGGKVGDYSGEMICTFGKIGLLGVYLRGGQGIVESMIGNY